MACMGRCERSNRDEVRESLVTESAEDSSMRMPVRPLRQLVPSTGQVAQDDERRKKKVRFAAKVQYRAIPSENKGRKCRGQARKNVETKWRSTDSIAGGATRKLQAETSTSRPRWADICEEEEEKEAMERATSAIFASGRSDSTADSIEAEEACEEKASDARRNWDRRLSTSFSRLRSRSPHRYLTGKVPSSGRQSISLSRLSKGELWDSGVSKGYRGWALNNDNEVAEHG